MRARGAGDGTLINYSFNSKSGFLIYSAISRAHNTIREMYACFDGSTPDKREHCLEKRRHHDLEQWNQDLLNIEAKQR